MVATSQQIGARLSRLANTYDGKSTEWMPTGRCRCPSYKWARREVTHFIATCWSAALNSAAALSETVSGDTVTSRSVSSRRTTGDGTGRAEPARSMVTTSCRKTNSASLHRCRCTGYHCITVCDYDGEQGEAKPPPEAHHVG